MAAASEIHSLFVSTNVIKPSNQTRPVIVSTDLPTTNSDNGPEDTDKITVEFVEPNKQARLVSAIIGQSLLDAALDAGVIGLSGQCGGAINCATCLCNIAPGQRVKVPPAHADELELLEWVDEASTNSRLSCQLIAVPDLAGLILQVVPTR